MPYREILKTIHPEEAQAISAKVKKLAEEVQIISTDLKQTAQELDSTWYGRAKVNFFSRFGHVPNKVSRLSNNLRNKSLQLKALSIVVTIVEWFDDSRTGGADGGAG
jgi:WXG100 family type VII secretion target